MGAGGGDELPQAYCLRARYGQRVVGALDHRQQRQFERHIALFETLHHVMHVGAAALAGLLEKRRVADESQALSFDAWVGVDLPLQLEAAAHALPDVVVGLRPGRVELHIDGPGSGAWLAFLADVAAGLAAGQDARAEQDGNTDGTSQCV
ncbi:hypothetical protein D3C81_1395370 [compost metagenome]